MTNFELQYQGYLNTPNLWINDLVFGMHQLEINPEFAPLKTSSNHKLRLGKLVERFVSNQLQQDGSINILSENFQVQREKQTLGELDCILTKNGQPIHLEIVYKFYLYDNSVGSQELEHWIGPNRKDSLLQKLQKLKEKQFPLLYNTYARSLLASLHVDIQEVKQEVLFKAQLFLPLEMENLHSKAINMQCVKGFYITPKNLDRFNACKFYIPEKLDWLMEVQINTPWITFEKFIEELIPILNNKTAPLCWLKKNNGELQKFFVVWW